MIKRKVNKSYVKWKGFDNSFNSWIDRKDIDILYKVSQCFCKPYEHYSGNVKVELDLSNYATKADLKGGTNLPTKSDLARLKAKLHKIDIDRISIKVSVKVFLSSTSRLVSKTQYDCGKQHLGKKY